MADLLGAGKARILPESRSVRLLGYNSPMVPASKRFWELQIPVVTKPTDG